MELEVFFAIVSAFVFAFGAYKRDTLIVGVGGVILALAVVFAWAVAG